MPELLLSSIQQSFHLKKVLFSLHARKEMREEQFGIIFLHEVFEIIENGKIIEQYPDDTPFPSCLIFGKTNLDRPLHVVCAYNRFTEETVVVTLYHPDPLLWIDYERRKI